MKIAITGATGMLGTALCETLGESGSLHPFSSQTLDITSLERVRETFSRLRPDWIIHAAAYTRVDDAQLNSCRAHRVNAVGTRNVAVAAYENGSSLLYFSTDYVFDGKQERAYREWDAPNPLNEYGRSKLAGELFVRTLCPAHIIIRTSWLFGPTRSNPASHFVAKILQRANQERCLKVVDDQRGSPTYSRDLARVTWELVRTNRRGTYHVTNSGYCTWYELARQIVSLRGLTVEVQPVSSSESPRPAPRPSNSVLDNYVLKLEAFPLPRSWQEALAEFLKA